MRTTIKYIIWTEVFQNLFSKMFVLVRSFSLSLILRSVIQTGLISHQVTPFLHGKLISKLILIHVYTQIGA